ncbi:uridine kinase [Zeaxanthinibacter enoshimensis]|uniref:Phosphoribulokinase n=2 Tax=Zeaxanthinibacter enoshimensis TaxID=392009 RepID=A0A4R6TNT2_9FLAO|nr:uridine kinase [Zeaxanthinibacter enoshimensis]
MAMNKFLGGYLRDKQGIFKLAVLRHRLFWGGLLLKIILSLFFAGRLLADSFIPFVEYFIASGFKDPYEHFWQLGVVDAFPYPPLMLYILSSLGGFLAHLSPFFIRIPLLLADTLILVLLSRLLRGKDYKILVYYWLSPVLIYISYIHGQLDVIPIAFLIASLYLLVKNRSLEAAVVLGLGIAAKTNLILAIPFFLLYLWKNNNQNKIGRIASHLGLVALVFLIVSSFYLGSKSFLQMVFSNQEQSKVWAAGLPTINNLNFYLIPAVYLLLIAAATRFKKISKDLFIMFVGFSFASLLIFIPPQPGWYFWILPFLIYFNLKERKLTFIPVIALQAAFLIYFAWIPNSDYTYVFLYTERGGTLYELWNSLGWVPAEFMVSLAFTLLQTCLILNVYWLFKAGVRKNLNRKLKNKPFLIGFGGDSGVGKSTLTHLMIQMFGEANVTIIRGDDMHRWERGHDKWNELTHLSPKANHLHEDIRHLKLLRTGKTIQRRIYDHTTGRFTQPLKIYPSRVVIFEGLHPFYIAAKRNLFDLKVFVEPKEDLRLYWKIQRDTAKRGYTKEKVLEQLRIREEDSAKFIRSQAPFSDVKICFYPLQSLPDDNISEQVELGLRIELETNLDINRLVDGVNALKTLRVTHEYEIDCQILDVQGTVSSDEIENLTYVILDESDDLLNDARFDDDLNGFLQLFFIFCILNKASNIQ